MEHPGEEGIHALGELLLVLGEILQGVDSDQAL